MFKAFHQERFSHRGDHYTLPPDVPYRGYDLKDLTLVPRPVHQPVECWQPVVSAIPRGLEFMIRHGIKGAVRGGAATMADGPIQAYQVEHINLSTPLTTPKAMMIAQFERVAAEVMPHFGPS